MWLSDQRQVMNGDAHVNRINRRKLLATGLSATSLALLASCGWLDEEAESEPTSERVQGTQTPNQTRTPTLSVAPTATEVPIWDDPVALTARGYLPEVQIAEDGRKHLVPLEHVTWGGVAKDGIPSIDRPHYVGPERWYEMVYDDDRLVVGVEVNGKQRAYPLQILIWHEIVNETFDGKHLLVTY